MRKTGTHVGETDSQDTQTVSPDIEWERGTENTPVYALVSAVAEADGSDPVELPPLYEAIDPDALNDLFTSRPGSGVGAVQFRYAGYDVVVRGSGEIEVRSEA